MELLTDNDKIENQYKIDLNNHQNFQNNNENSDNSIDDQINIEVDQICVKTIKIEEINNNNKHLLLDGYSLAVEDLVNTSDINCQIKLKDDARQRILDARKFLEKVAAEHKIIYGITTGFGTFANLNLIRSHATGYGKPLEPAKARMLLALRINVLAKGHSGISLENLDKLIDAFNAYCVSYVPEQGTVGCSGDLCPLAHLALGLLGEGQMWSPSTGWAPASDVLKHNGLRPIELSYKEGLALINGTQLVSSIGSLAVVRAENLAKQADVIAALTLDVLKGTTRAFDAKVHKVRPHKGQNLVAGRLRALLHSDLNRSEIAESHRHCGKVQDAYTLRCVPQVHGVTHDTIEFVKELLNIEINSATDNPLIFSDVEEIISGAIAVHELAQMSERRLERLVNYNLKNNMYNLLFYKKVNHELSGLPTFLTQNGGLNSGFMTVQLCAASLVSENKVLCHPSSADSIPTSCNQEDHVSMGGFSARKALKVVEHTEAGIPLNDDRYMQPEIQSVISLVRSNKIWTVVEPHLERMSKLESCRPDLLRQEAGSPTAAVLGPFFIFESTYIKYRL
uniref:Histidine ammonia-lyase n=2 Tax=Meloidogyne incognita group TaxID=654580 RepID=A0A915LUN2_MELJA